MTDTDRKEAEARPLRLSWGEHGGRGEPHIEWHAPCGCAYHPEPNPHVHACNEHRQGSAFEAGRAAGREEALKDAETEIAACDGRHEGVSDMLEAMRDLRRLDAQETRHEATE